MNDGVTTGCVLQERRAREKCGDGEVARSFGHKTGQATDSILSSLLDFFDHDSDSNGGATTSTKTIL